MPRHGRTPDEERRQQVATLRAQGLTFSEIGKRLGMSRQGASDLLIRSGKQVQLPGILCRECKREICPWNAKWRGGMHRHGPVYCLGCLAKHQQATIGERILAFRMNAGMTQAEVQAATGFRIDSLGSIERNRITNPYWKTLKILAEFFGPELLGIKGKLSGAECRTSAHRVSR
jgi:transcriptional regulator with XRE-family HTH domain